MDRSALFTLALLVGIAALFSVNFASTNVAAIYPIVRLQLTIEKGSHGLNITASNKMRTEVIIKPQRGI